MVLLFPHRCTRLRPVFLFFIFSLFLASCTLENGNIETGPTSDETVILVSIDGFRTDYIEKLQLPNLSRLASGGVHADEGMIPVFPTKTFPNHYSIATGLYPENHGIIANTMYDAELDAWFRISDRDAVEDPRWWGGEPIWVTAEKQGMTTATFFFVGSEAEVQGIQPTYWYPFDESVPEIDRVDQVLAWLDLPADERPQFISLYFELVDQVGHTYGIYSSENESAVRKVDGYIGRLLSGLEQREIGEKVNLILVSDHGMSERSPERVLALDDYVDLEEVDLIDTSPVLMMNSKNGNAAQLVAQLENAHPQLRVWLREEVPEEYHFRNHHRIPEIIGQVGDGWTMYRTREFMRENVSQLKGATHGYAPDALSMRALFLAYGPAFRSGMTIAPFENIHIYALLAEILGLDPADTDGSLDVLSPILRD